MGKKTLRRIKKDDMSKGGVHPEFRSSQLNPPLPDNAFENLPSVEEMVENVREQFRRKTSSTSNPNGLYDPSTIALVGTFGCVAEGCSEIFSKEVTDNFTKDDFLCPRHYLQSRVDTKQFLHDHVGNGLQNEFAAGASNPDGEAVTRPPRVAEFLVSCLTPCEKRNELVAQLTDYYTEMVEQYGDRSAKWLYYIQVSRSLLPIIAHAIEWLVKFKILQLLGYLVIK